VRVGACEGCKMTDYLEKHHIVFRKQNKVIEKWVVNQKDLCMECHRGNDGPHLNRITDLKYKRELQQIIETELTSEYYRENELMLTLGLTVVEVQKTVKTLSRSSWGYRRMDIVKELMGGKLY